VLFGVVMKRQHGEAKGTQKLDVDETEEVTVHRLEDKQSWLITSTLKVSDRPTQEEVEQLWAQRPESKGRIMLMGKSMETPRYTQTYNDSGKGYRFSGTEHNALPIPVLLKRYLNYANSVCHTMLTDDYDGRQFNMALLNYYPDGRHSIDYHSDDEKQIYLNKRGETLVFSISLGQTRRFLVKSGDKASKEKTLTLSLVDNTVVVMGGLCQAHYKHKVPKTEQKNVGRRLNLTFRIFK